MAADVREPLGLARRYKIPRSVLVVVHTRELDVLLLRRADVVADFWQSVTGSLDRADEPPAAAAAREVREETGIEVDTPGANLLDWRLENRYEIYPRWRHRYAPGVTHNCERVFGLELPRRCPIRLAPSEHTDFGWWPHRAAAERCFSPSNAQACLLLPRFAAGAAP